MTPGRVWSAFGLLYAAFFAWYTSFAGPLEEEEIQRYLAFFAENGAEPDQVALWRNFMESDTGDDFAMLNAIEMRERPLPVEGAPPGETSEQVLARYTAPFLGRALRSAAHPVMLGRAAADAIDLWGIDGAEEWSTGGLVRYRSRRDLMEQVVAVGPTGIHEFKTAAMEKTIAYPLDPWFQLGDPRLVAIAGEVGKTPAQVLIRWGLDKGFLTIPKSSNPVRIRENAGVFGWSLSEAQIAALDALDEGYVSAWNPLGKP